MTAPAPIRQPRGMVDGEFLLTTADFNAIARMLHAETGIALHEGKATLLYSRLGKRLRALGMRDFRSYCELLEDPEQADERGKMIRALTTNVTKFFREPHHFDHLRDVVLPPLLRKAEAGARVRIWSAACSTGQEPYSLALTVLRLLPNAANLDVRVLATDIDTTVLEQARAGRYDADAVAMIPLELRTRWFDRAGGDWQAGEMLRRMISFRPLNLIGPWPMRGRFDVIMCRNVVIYFGEETQVEIWNRFTPLIVPGGFLYIGHSERISGPATASYVSAGITTYQRRPRAMTSVVVVDDSPTMRALIKRALQSHPDIKVIGEACDPMQAREAIKSLNPDVITLDIEMPQMNGLDFLERLMRLRPMPVVMVSTLTSRGAEATLRALELGAVDCVAKPRFEDRAGFDRLAEIVRTAATARVRPLSNAPPAPAPVEFSPSESMLAIGASTGGVEALLAILAHFPANCPPTLITQHMPAAFTPSFAQRLNRSSAATVTEATDGARLMPGQVYLAPGGLTHLEVAGPPAGPWRCRLVKADLVNGHRPSVDVLFHSVAAVARHRSVGVILTGMGKDGAQGLVAMRQAGARTIGQDEHSSVVYGMPKAAFELGGVGKQVPLHAACAAMLAACNAKTGDRACRPPLPSRC